MIARWSDGVEKKDSKIVGVRNWRLEDHGGDDDDEFDDGKRERVGLWSVIKVKRF